MILMDQQDNQARLFSGAQPPAHKSHGQLDGMDL
jgi:hypothetical protein